LASKIFISTIYLVPEPTGITRPELGEQLEESVSDREHHQYFQHVRLQWERTLLTTVTAMPAEYGICFGSLQFFASVSSSMRNHDISGSLHCHFMSSPIEKTQRLKPF
jgi:tRNA(Ile2) C34 agmatinyltransferase TiaS